MTCLLLAAETWASRKEEAQLPSKVLRRLLPVIAQEENHVGGLPPSFGDAGSSGALYRLSLVSAKIFKRRSMFSRQSAIYWTSSAKLKKQKIL